MASASMWDDPDARLEVFRAAERGDAAAVRAAVLAGFPPTAVNNRRQTLLLQLIIHLHPALKSLVPLLLEHGWDVNAADIFGDTAVLSACLKGQLDTLQLLVQAGGSLTAIHKTGFTVVHWNVVSRHLCAPMLEWLATRPEVDWHHRCRQGRDALYCLEVRPRVEQCRAIAVAAMAAQRAREARWSPLRAAFVAAVVQGKQNSKEI